MSALLAIYLLGLLLSGFMSVVSYSVSEVKYNWFDFAAVLLWPLTLVLFAIYNIRKG